MKGSIIYVKGHEKSEIQAHQAYESFNKHGWNVEMVEGVTPETLDDKEWDVECIKGGRLIGFQQNGERSYLTKKSCLTNHARLWRKVIEKKQPMAFIEQDAICVGPAPSFTGDVLVLNVDYAFFPPSVLGSLARMRGYMPSASLTPISLPSDYPLTYYKNNVYKGHAMMPGTAAYVVTPKGAKKLLKAADKHGIDQSDFFINNHNVEIEYISPSPVKFNTVNLNLSHKL